MQSPTLGVRATTFSAAHPAIIVPLTAPDADGVLAEAARAVAAGADCLEWRVDLFDGVGDAGAVADVLGRLRGVAGELPVLATLRTETEGGRFPVGGYLAALRLLVAGGADLVDVEVLRDGAADAITDAHAAGVLVVGSHHVFDGTPPEDSLVAALEHADALGADLAKLAVMPADALDTLTLLRATARRFAVARRPLLTIAMGRHGAVSRVVAPTFGSCATFATVPDAEGLDRPSAPGQATLAVVRAALDALARVTR